MCSSDLEVGQEEVEEGGEDCGFVAVADEEEGSRMVLLELGYLD